MVTKCLRLWHRWHWMDLKAREVSENRRKRRKVEEKEEEEEKKDSEEEEEDLTRKQPRPLPSESSSSSGTSFSPSASAATTFLFILLKPLLFFYVCCSCLQMQAGLAEGALAVNEERPERGKNFQARMEVELFLGSFNLHEINAACKAVKEDMKINT